MIGFDGSMNTGLTLRTAHIRDGIAAVRAGATLLYDSDPDAGGTRDPPQGPRPARDPARGRGPDGRRATPEPARRVRLADYPGRGAGRGRGRSASCSSTTRTRSCTPWPTTSASTARRSPRCAPASPPRARRDRPRPRRALARARPPGRLRLRRAADRAGRAEAARVRRLPRPAGDGRARGRRAVAAARAAHGKPGRVQVRGGAAPVRRAAAGVHRRPLPLPVREGRATSRAASRSPRSPATASSMAIEDEAACRWAVQFHPESILTAAGRSGHQVIANVLVRAAPAPASPPEGCRRITARSVAGSAAALCDARTSERPRALLATGVDVRRRVVVDPSSVELFRRHAVSPRGAPGR